MKIKTTLYNNVKANNSLWDTVMSATVNEYLNAGESVLAIEYYEGIYNRTKNFLKVDFIYRYVQKNKKIVKFI